MAHFMQRGNEQLTLELPGRLEVLEDEQGAKLDRRARLAEGLKTRLEHTRPFISTWPQV